MARLPRYAASTNTIDTGSDTLQRVPDTGAAIATGLQRFGEGVADAADRIGKAELAVASKAKSNDKIMEGLQEQRDFEKFEQQTASVFEQSKRNADPTGAKFEETHISEFDKVAEEYAGGAKTELSRAKRALAIERLKTNHIKQAGHYETSLALNAVKQVQESTYLDAGGIAGQLPNAEGRTLGEQKIRDTADRLNLPPRAKERFINEGIAHVERQALAGKSVVDPYGMADVGKDIYQNMPTSKATGEQAKIIEGANAAGINPKVMLGIGFIESRHNPNTTTSLSSTQGVFQFLKGSAYGDKTKPWGGIDPKDTRGQAEALGHFLQRIDAKHTAQGRPLTPGQLFSFHNVGEGVANRLLNETDGNKKMGTVLFETYGNSRFSPDHKQYPNELIRDVVGRNNPSLYKPGMSVDEVRASYEAKMKSAMAQGEGAVTGSTATAAPDEVIRAKLTAYMGFDVKHIGASDLNQAIGIAQKAIQAESKKKVDDDEGYALITGQIRMSPNDPEQKKRVNEFYRRVMRDRYDGFVRGDEEAVAKVHLDVKNMNYIPAPITEAARELVHSGTDGKARIHAFEFMSSIRKGNPTAFNSSSIEKETEDRLTQYEVNLAANMTPLEAVKRVDYQNSPEGKKERAALKSVLDGEKGELQKLDPDLITAELSKGLVRNGIYVNRDGVEDKSIEARMMADARPAYEKWRLAEYPVEQAVKLAAADVARDWGPSVAFTPATKPARIMRFPPDRYYAQPATGMKPFEDQVRELVETSLAFQHPLSPEERSALVAKPKPGRSITAMTRAALSDTPERHSRYTADDVTITITEAPETKRDIERGEPPRYIVNYRDPRTGAVVMAYGGDGQAAWRPSVDRLHAEDREVRVRKQDEDQKNAQWWSDQMVPPKELGNIIRDQFKPTKR